MTYTVTLTDGNSCRATDQVTVNVQDVRCGPANQNVQICYYGVSQCVSQAVAARYLKLGATIGACGAGNTRIGYEAETTTLSLTVKAYPNPAQDAVTVEVLSPAAGSATFLVLDLTGRARQSRTEPLAQGLNQVQFQLGGLPTGMYIIQAQDILGRNAAVRVKKQ